jgi:hypothetical protein
MSILTITNTRFLEVTETASDLSLVLRENRTEAAQESALQLSAAENRLQETRRLKDTADAQRRAANAMHAAVRDKVRVAVFAAISIGKFFEYPEIASFSCEAKALHLSLGGLEQRFLLRGEAGLRFAERLNLLAEAYQHASSMMNAAHSECEAASREHSVAYYRLNSAIGLAKAVLKSQGLPLPRPPARPRRKRRPVPALTVPVNEGVRLAPPPAPMSRAG